MIPAPHGPGMRIYKALILTLRSANFNDMVVGTRSWRVAHPKRVKRQAAARAASVMARGVIVVGSLRMSEKTDHDYDHAHGHEVCGAAIFEAAPDPFQEGNTSPHILSSCAR